MKKLETLTFKKFCMTIGNLPSSYVESLSYYECLMWLCKYLEDTVIPAVNNNSEAVEELQNLFVELKNYVDTYFDNLDVQEEINNKLDEMAESGQLAEIIALYLNANCILAYNIVTDITAAENLQDGSFARTYGKLSYNDGYGAFYKVRPITSGDVVDGDNIVAITSEPTLIAEKIPNNYIGDLTTLDTTSKQVVGAINELHTAISNAEDDIEDINDEIDKMKAKKRMLLFGDSWSMSNYPYVEDQSVCWYNKVANYLDANLNNYAVSGAGFLINNNTILSQVNNAIANETNPEEVDYVFVEGGYNDLNFTNNVAYSTIIDSVKAVFNTITSTFINAKVYFLADNTPHKLLKTERGTQTQLYNTYGFYQYFQSAIVECDSTNITVIDMIPFLLGMSDTVQETLHPNTKGMHILSKSIIDSLKGNYTRQTLIDSNATYTASVAITGSPNITNTKNVINQNYMEVTFNLYQDTAYNMQLQYGYWLDELPTIYLPNNISVVSTDGKHTINANLTVDGGRNKMILTLPNNTVGYFDITLRIPLR